MSLKMTLRLGQMKSYKEHAMKMKSYKEHAIMSKKCMLEEIETRLKYLKQVYYNTCEGLRTDGTVGTYCGSRTRRSKAKRDICILTLIQDLLYEIEESKVELSEDAILGFDKLIGE